MVSGGQLAPGLVGRWVLIRKYWRSARKRKRKGGQPSELSAARVARNWLRQFACQQTKAPKLGRAEWAQHAPPARQS